MEYSEISASERILKRKSPEKSELGGCVFPLDELNQDVLEKVLSWLPTSSFFRLSSVCKRWKSIADSPTFQLACSEIPSRNPWFFMVDSQTHLNPSPIIFDSSEMNWKILKYPSLRQQNSFTDFIPIAASGGLVCFHRAPKDFILYNPVSNKYKQLPPMDSAPQVKKPLSAVAMISSPNPQSYKLVAVSGELSELSFRVYNSRTSIWEEEVLLKRKIESDNSNEMESSDDQSVYFLSKCGNVVSTNLQRSPSKQFSSVITLKDGQEMLYFFSSAGTVVACDLTQGCFSEYPRLLPMFHEYSIDMVECGGEMFVAVLSEFLESASLRVWKFDEKMQCWLQVAAMPPALSHEFYGKKVDINCCGAGQQILVCVNSAEFCSNFLFNLVANQWMELPNCRVNGNAREFNCAFSFEPRVEALT